MSLYDFVGHEAARLQTYFSYRSWMLESFGAELAILVDQIARGTLGPEIGFEGSWRDFWRKPSLYSANGGRSARKRARATTTVNGIMAASLAAFRYPKALKPRTYGPPSRTACWKSRRRHRSLSGVAGGLKSKKARVGARSHLATSLKGLIGHSGCGQNWFHRSSAA